MKRRILSIITALALCLSLCPTWAFAAEADPALCPHHPVHTGECGYAAPTEGHDCGHEHREGSFERKGRRHPGPRRGGHPSRDSTDA